MKKVLWLSNFEFSDKPSKSSGTWIESMGKGFAGSGNYEICNVTVGFVDKAVVSDFDGVKQWIIPFGTVDRKQAFSCRQNTEILRICDNVQPDLVHVWGTERPWGLLTATGKINKPALLEMQGVKFAMAPYMTGCLTGKELLQCRYVKEYVKPSSRIESAQERFASCLAQERTIIGGHKYIDYQSEWVRDHISQFVGEQSILFKTKMSIRKEFSQAEPWCVEDAGLTIFSACGCSPNKGLHTLIRAFALLRRNVPNACLTIAGSMGQDGLRMSGYRRFVNREIERLGLSGCVEILGQISALEMIEKMRNSAVTVIPSFVESYSLTLAEAMALGCPIVVTYAGAMPELAKDKEDVLFFPVADAGKCAEMILSLIRDKGLCLRIGSSARAKSLKMHSVDDAVARQTEIYDSILSAGGQAL